VASVGSWEMDAKTRLTKWSDEKYKILGLEPQKDIPSLPLLLSFIHPEDLERIRESFEQLFFSPRNTSFNYRIVRTDGTIRYLFSNSKCVFDTQRALVRLHGITQDITETRLAEQKIEFEHRNQEALINNTKDLMWSVDKDLKLITCNEAFNQVVKYLSGNSINKGDPVLSKGFSEKQLIRWNELYKRALSGESFTQIEYNDSPYERWSEISFSPIRKEDQIIGTACYSRDITERQKAQEDLKTLTERHTLATASAKIGIWDYDNVNNILVWDEKMYEIFDVPKDKFSGAYEAWSRTVHPEDISIAAAELQDAINGVKDFHTVFRIIWPNEELRYIEAHAFALKNREGKTIRMIGVNWDITERKKTEQDLLEKVGEMDAFIYRASHDLRGPLASIAGLTNLGREEIKDKKSIFYLDKIHDSVTRLDNILQELSKIARVTQAKIEPTEINLKKEIDDILDSLKHLPNYAQIGFIKEINVPVLFSDKILLIIILQNLIINSINYYDEKKEKPFLHIKTFENINGIKIILSDNGVGIPADMQEKVFEMFFRGTNTSKGSGLGLYIVKNAIKKLNGTIHLASNEGEGTTFSINLPKGT
jgi:PAS domain S-box-containing protein